MPPKNARERHPSDRERRSVHKFFVCFYYLEIGKIFLDLGPVVYLRVWIKGPVGAHAQEISHLEIFAEPNAFRVRVACVNGSSTLAEDQPDESREMSERSMRLAVPSECSLIRLTIEGLPGSTSSTSEFDDFRLIPN